MSFTTAASAAKMAKIRALLKAKPKTVTELAPLVPISRRWALAYIQHLITDERVYIASWTREVEGHRAYLRPVYAHVKAPTNATKPPALTEKQIKARLHKRMMADPERHMDHLAKERARRITTTGPRADIAARWMFNEVAA